MLSYAATGLALALVFFVPFFVLTFLMALLWCRK